VAPTTAHKGLIPLDLLHLACPYAAVPGVLEVFAIDQLLRQVLAAAVNAQPTITRSADNPSSGGLGISSARDRLWVPVQRDQILAGLADSDMRPTGNLFA
jgi:hypothetical protein